MTDVNTLSLIIPICNFRVYVSDYFKNSLRMHACTTHNNYNYER